MKDDMTEEWRPIEGFEGFYEVNNKGVIRSVDRVLRNGVAEYVRKGRVLSQRQTNSGYLQVDLSKNNMRHAVYVHRIVACAFIPNPFLLPQINHKDENKLNNRVENLEWCTRIYNMNYGSFPQKRLKKATEERNNKKRSRKVYQYGFNGILLNIYPSLHEVERLTGIKQERVSKACRGKGYHRTLCGFIWSFESLSIEKIDKIIFHCPKPIVQLTKEGKFVNRYKTAKAAAIALGCNANGIQLCCRGLQKTCVGFIWKYEHKYNNNTFQI